MCLCLCLCMCLCMCMCLCLCLCMTRQFQIFETNFFPFSFMPDSAVMLIVSENHDLGGLESRVDTLGRFLGHELVTTKPFKEPPREATCYMQLYCSCLVLDPSCSKARFVSLLYEPLQGNKFMKLRSDRCNHHLKAWSLESMCLVLPQWPFLGLQKKVSKELAVPNAAVEEDFWADVDDAEYCIDSDPEAPAPDTVEATAVEADANPKPAEPTAAVAVPATEAVATTGPAAEAEAAQEEADPEADPEAVPATEAEAPQEEADPEAVATAGPAAAESVPATEAEAPHEEHMPDADPEAVATAEPTAAEAVPATEAEAPQEEHMPDADPEPEAVTAPEAVADEPTAEAVRGKLDADDEAMPDADAADSGMQFHLSQADWDEAVRTE
eukprot:jgi/Astpho2/5817/fgenesh1_pg.00080_%23_67_t